MAIESLMTTNMATDAKKSSHKNYDNHSANRHNHGYFGTHNLNRGRGCVSQNKPTRQLYGKIGHTV